MRFPPLRTTNQRATRGVALIIVLAFVVLLTGVVIAFFSRSLSERQISNSSAGQVKIDLFTQGAIATITDDLKQEIAAGSNAMYYTDSTQNGALVGSVYLPVNPATTVPALALKGSQKVVTSFPANLVKRSAYGQNFFPGSGDVGAGNYNTNNTTATVSEPTVPGATPSPSAAPTPPPSNRAANLSTTIASQNGRAISPARWNKALLLPKASPPPSTSTDTTPYFVDPGNPHPTSSPVPAPNGVEFVPPDWVLVARDGSNPGRLNTPATFSGTVAVNNPSPSNQGYVTGRYAYTIYDEGGLLDANVAGYPTAATAYPSNGTASLPPTPTYKTALAYADLTIPVPLDVSATAAANGSTQPLLSAPQVNALVGWRNYASSQPVSGTFPTYVPAPTASPASSPVYSPFDGSVLTNLNGFMGVSNAPLYKNQSDRMFGSRQELINFFTQVLPTVDNTNPQANLQNSLQYFGTFSRGLNQPSYAPVSRVASATNPNPRPLIQPSVATGGQPGGGNSVGDFYPKAVDQDIFSPSLLPVRAEAAFTRNDGTTTAVVGEPLVKSRFALQRLAWLTFVGPIASTDGTKLNPTGNADIAKIISTLENSYGLTDAYLKKGTAANIQKYFGLYWDTPNHIWKYSVHNGGNTSGTSATGSIMKLRDIADQKMREPDFFELLKASVDVGALGKASTNAKQAELGEPSGNADSHLEPLNFQFFHDVAVDAAIIQIGANIIDQFDLDGYPTRIVFDDGSGVREIRGVENLPYIYRIRLGSLKVREANPSSQAVPNGAGSYQTPILHSGTMAGYTANPLKDTGAGVVMAVPDIWNPHDQNSSMGVPRPGTGTALIRLVANSATPDTVYTTADPPPIPPTTPSGYNTYTCGTFVGTDSATATTPGHGGLRKTSYFDATTPNPGATPAPIPCFTRVANPTGIVAPGSAGVMSGSNGGFNYPHPIDTITSSYLTFKVPDETLYREPTMLGIADPSGPSALTMVVDPSNLDILKLTNASGASMYVNQYGLKSANPLNGFAPNPLQTPTAPSNPITQAYCGITLGTYPLRWVGPNWSGAAAGTIWHYTAASLADAGLPNAAVTYSLQYQDPVTPTKWITYDEKYIDSDLSFVDPYQGQLVQPKGGAYSFVDPRTPRFGSATESNISGPAFYRAPLAGSTTTWLDNPPKSPLGPPSVVTERFDNSSGFGSNFRAVGDWGIYPSPGLHSMNLGMAPSDGKGVNSIFFQTGLLAQNDPYFQSDGKRFMGEAGLGSRDANFVSDPDGVVRRGVGAYVLVGTNMVGQPLASASTVTGGVDHPTAQSQSRPIILNHPFRTVGELGCVFTGIPWKNVDFSTPESGYSELLDVFCANDNAPSDGLVAGTVNLNTRQPMVLKSVLTGAYTDEENGFTPVIKGATPVKPLVAADAEAIATLLKQRTSTAPPASTSFYAANGPQPLQNVADMVGRWNANQSITGNFTPALGSVHNVDGSKSYDGFSADLTSLKTTNLTNLTTDNVKIPRLRESAIRALSNVGNTRVWNLMIDVIAQNGRYTPTATALKTTGGGDNFVVEGEQRYWVHLAIDRYTGAVLDTKLELVKE